MSQTVLITKRVEWSSCRRTTSNNENTNNNNNKNNNNSSNNNVEFGTETILRRAHSRDIHRPKITVSILSQGNETTGTHKTQTANPAVDTYPVVDSERRRNVFQPLVMLESTNEMEDLLSASGDTEDTSRASPTSIVSTTTDPTWVITPTPPSASGFESDGNTTDTRNDRMEQLDNLSLPHDSGNSHYNTRIQELEAELQEAKLELARLQEIANNALSQRSKTLGNLKKKRAELLQALDQKTVLEQKLEESSRQQTLLVEENASLKTGLSKLALTKDTIKLKLKTKDELYKECCREKDALKGQLQQLEHCNALERELLEHYRKLARHTGYYRWGKPIRTLENQLAERGGGGGGGGNGGEHSTLSPSTCS